jgi:DNA-binding transcriptional LysR family regulator
MFAQQSAAAAGAGIVLLPSFAGEHDARLVSVLKPEVSTRRPIILSVHEDLGSTPRVRVVTKFLKELVASDQKFLIEGYPDVKRRLDGYGSASEPCRRSVSP